jgi:teichuronic acid exporter
MKAQKDSTMTIKKATFITALPKYINVIFLFVVNIFLSRILTPEDFGIVAVVMVFITFFTLFSDMGYGTAYIQKEDATIYDRDQLFSFLSYVGLFLIILFFGFAYGIAWFYKSQEYIHISWVMGLSVGLTAISAIPSSSLLREQKFVTVGVVTLVSTFVSAGLAIVFAYCHFAYWAIVLENLLNSLIGTICYIALVRPHFHFRIDWSVIKKYTGFSLGLLGFSFINFFSRNIDNLLIGRIFNEEQLGFYDKAYKTSRYPMTYFSGIIGSSITPVLAKHQRDSSFIYEEYKRIFIFLLEFGIFLSLILYFSSSETILILYGDQWQSSIAPFKWLALSLWVQIPLNVTGSFFQVLGKTKKLFIIGTISAILNISGIAIGLSYGSIEAVAMWYCFSQFLNFFVTSLYIQVSLFREKILDIYKDVFILLLCFGACFASSYFLFQAISIANIYYSFLAKFGLSTFLYLFSIIVSGETGYLLNVIFPKKWRAQIALLEKGKRLKLFSRPFYSDFSPKSNSSEGTEKKIDGNNNGGAK